MCFGIGANDAANSWGTSVGSGAISLTQAVLLGGVMEWLGALGLGYGVAKTIKGWFCFLFWFFGFLVFWFLVFHRAAVRRPQARAKPTTRRAGRAGTATARCPCTWSP